MDTTQQDSVEVVKTETARQTGISAIKMAAKTLRETFTLEFVASKSSAKRDTTRIKRTAQPAPKGPTAARMEAASLVQLGSLRVEPPTQDARNAQKESTRATKDGDLARSVLPGSTTTKRSRPSARPAAMAFTPRKAGRRV